MKDFTATNAEFESIDISEKFQISESGAIGGVIPSGVNDIIKWDGDKWIAGVNPGGSGNSGGSYVANPFSTNLISGQSIQGILFGQALDSAPSIATDLEIDGDGSIIPYTISGINTTGYTAIFAEEIPNNNYKIHTVFGGGGGGGSSSSYWQTGASDLYYNDNNVNIQRDLTIGGNLTVNGTQTIVNTETVEIEDHNLVIGANTHYTGFANPYPGAGDAYAGILWGTGDAGAASSVGLTYQSNKGFAFEGGNVGIGTTDPKDELHVNNSDSAAIITVTSKDTSSARLYLGDQSNKFRAGLVYDNGDDSFALWGYDEENFRAERIRINSAGNVGIGTTSPSEKLHIEDADSNARINLISSAEHDSAILFGDTGDSVEAGILYKPAVQKLFIRGYNNLDRMTIDSAGNVGIGTTDPESLLHLMGSDTAILRLGNSDTSLTPNQIVGGVEFEKLDPSGAGAGVVGGLKMYAEGPIGESTYLTLSTSSPTINNKEAMRITSVGNVGIGTTTPSANLEIKGGSEPFAIYDANDEKKLRTFTASNGTVLALTDGDNDIIRLDGRTTTPNVSYFNGGNVGIGTTNPGAKLQLVGNFKVTKTAIDGGDNALYLNVGGNADHPMLDIYDKDGNAGARITGNGDSWISAQGGNVGIGVTDPNTRLEIAQPNGNSGLTLNYIPSTYRNRYKSDLYHDGVGNLKIESWAGSATTAGDILLAPNGGNVGIGTTDPGAKLEVYNNSTSNLYPMVHNESAGNAGWRLKNNQGDWVMIANAALRFYDVGQSLERMRIDEDGNVGIGITSPNRFKAMFSNSSTLSIGGTKAAEIELGFNGSAYSNFVTGTGGLAFMNYSNSGSPTAMDKNSIFVGGIYCQTVSDSLTSNPNGNAGGRLRFYTKPIDGAPVECMRIDDHGNVGIGTTNPFYKLDVRGNQPTWASYIRNENNVPYGLSIQYPTGGPDNTSSEFIKCFVGSNARFHVTSNGNVYVKSLQITSDDRIKHNEQPIVGALKTLSKITPKKYIKTTEVYDSDHDFALDADGNPVDESGKLVEHTIEAGVIAQQVLSVDELAFAVSPESVDEDGAVTSPHSLDYNSLFTYAIAAIQEQQQLIEQLKSQNESLAARISALES